MKIRPSLRLYFIFVVLFLATSMAVVFSIATVNYYIEGMDQTLKSVMYKAALSENVKDGQPVEKLGFIIASRWEDIPESIQTKFDPKTLNDTFEYRKRIEHSSAFSRPSAGYFLLKLTLKDKQVRYVLKVLERKDSKQPGSKINNKFKSIILFVVAAMAVFFVLLVLLLKIVAAPIEALRDWAKPLSAETLKLTPPDFKYSELNTLASIIHNSLNSVQESLMREQNFLRHASHELRTPIAVVCSSVELLKKINKCSDKKQNSVIHRIENAGNTMSNLTDTLLWLSQEEDVALQQQTVELNELVKKIEDELHYLLEGKNVKIELNTAFYQLEIAKTACRIVLTNLIRNAFQHTYSGSVTITQKENSVEIININSEVLAEESNKLGFGFGLKLTKKLSERLGWFYVNEENEKGHKVRVVFNGKNNN